MQKKFLSLLTVFYLISCSSNDNSGSNAHNDKPVTPDSNNFVSEPPLDTLTKISKSDNRTDTLKSLLKGAWTDGSLETANFDIQPNRIFYIDQGSSYLYSLRGNTLTITYPDYSYEAKVSLEGDTLIMESKEYGESKFWRFKN